MVCYDVQVELALKPITGEKLARGTNQAPDASLDVHGRGFWERQRSAFFDIKVCHPNADSYRDLCPRQIYSIHENEKKGKYNSRVTEIEQGTFTPLVFTKAGVMADECLRYHSRLAKLLSERKQDRYATTISWVWAKVSFSILRSALLCRRGSRTLRRRNLDIKDSDLEIEKESSRTSLDSTAVDTLLLYYWDVHGFFFKFIDSFPDHQRNVILNYSYITFVRNF